MTPPNFHGKRCPECGESFTAMHTYTKYCSPECKRSRDNRVRRRHDTRCSKCGGETQ
jgi:hypothetical protein